MKCTAVDFSDSYNHGRENRLSVCWKGSTYSAPTDCKHFNLSLLVDLPVLKTASGYPCYNNTTIVHTIALMSPLAVNKAGALTFSGYCTAGGTWLMFLLSYLFAYLLTSWSTVLLQKLTGSQPVRNFPYFMEPEGSSPHSQEPATCLYPETARTSPYPDLYSTELDKSHDIRLLPQSLIQQMAGPSNSALCHISAPSAPRGSSFCLQTQTYA